MALLSKQKETRKQVQKQTGKTCQLFRGQHKHTQCMAEKLLQLKVFLKLGRYFYDYSFQ